MSQIDMEKLLPIVAELTERFTSRESTSVSYDKARQLMGAALYLINENRNAVKSSLFSCEDRVSVGAGREAAGNVALEKLMEEKTESELYESGKILAMERVQEAVRIYERILPRFHDYGVRCCHDTVIDGMPGFFKQYDVRYNPQDQILTLDYPVMGSMTPFKGIDAISTYLDRIYLEQSFLEHFTEEGVRKILEGFYGDYEELFINPCQAVMRDMVCRLMKEELRKLQEDLKSGGEKEKIREQLKREVARSIVLLVRELYKEGGITAKQLKAYLLTDASDFCAELMNAAEHYHLNSFS